MNWQYTRRSDGLIAITLDNNVWDFLFARKIDLAAELPSDEFVIFITREVEIERTAISDTTAKALLRSYLFGAICPARGVGAALALPYADTDMMQLHLDEIARNVAEGAHAVLLLDRAGWHTTSKLDVPKNITPIFLPSRAPELNPVENVWQYLRQNWLSNTVFENYDAIIDAASAAWRKLIAQPETITSIGMRGWAHLGHPL